MPFFRRSHEGAAVRPEFDRDVVLLKRDALLRIVANEGRSIVCLRGTVWLTQEADRRDIVLAPGATFTLDRAGIALAWATGGDAALVLDEELHAEPVKHAAKRRFAAADTPLASIDAIETRYDPAKLATLSIGMRNAIIQREAKWLRDQVITALLRSAARRALQALRSVVIALLAPVPTRTVLRRAE